MLHICSGCDNLCDVSQQYCDACLLEIAGDDAAEQFEVYGDPEPEQYLEVPCDHEFHEIGGRMAQCIYCGVIED